jgi:hypothetical protein
MSNESLPGVFALSWSMKLIGVVYVYEKRMCFGYLCFEKASFLVKVYTRFRAVTTMSRHRKSA